MPATKKITGSKEGDAMDHSAPQASDIKKLGIVAGAGKLPHKLLSACHTRGIEPFIVGFEGQTDASLMKGHNHFWGCMGAAGQIIKTLKAHDIQDLVLIGSIRRPSFLELKPDFKTAEFFARIGIKALGDNDLLVCVKDALEKDGFRIHGIQDFADDLLSPTGILGRIKPNKQDRSNIDRGVEVCQALGVMDVGQSVIVQEGIVLGVEAVEGTDALIQRCKHLKRKGRGGVLVKMRKPGQDKSLDLPTIGPDTVRHIIDAGLSGVAVHAGHSLLVDPDEVVALADAHKKFIIGIETD